MKRNLHCFRQIEIELKKERKEKKWEENNFPFLLLHSLRIFKLKADGVPLCAPPCVWALLGWLPTLVCFPGLLLIHKPEIHWI